MKRLWLAAAISAIASTSFAQDMFLRNATLFTGDGEVAGLDVLIENGRIMAMSANLDADDGAEIVEGAYITHPLFAPMSTLGLVDIGAENSTNDTSANTTLSSASIRATDSYNSRTSYIANARRRGIGFAAVAPNPAGDTIFGGTGMIADLSDEKDGILDDAAFLHVALGQSGAGRSGGSRGAALAQFRGALDDARRPYNSQDEGDILRRRDAQALRPVLSGRIPVMIRANRASDLMRIVDLKAGYPALDIIIVEAREAYLVAGALAGAGIRVVIDPQDNLPDNFDGVNASFDNAVLLADAGVEFAIANTSSLGVSKAGNLPQHAGNAVGNGLPRSDAIAAITSVPAGWFGIDLGNIEAGERANLIVWDGDPLDVTSAPIAMYRDGESVSLESRMTALRDRYNPLRRDDRPHKYR